MISELTVQEIRQIVQCDKEVAAKRVLEHVRQNNTGWPDFSETAAREFVSIFISLVERRLKRIDRYPLQG